MGNDLQAHGSGDYEFPDTVTVEGDDLVLNGSGIRRIFFVNVYLGIYTKMNNLA